MRFGMLETLREFAGEQLPAEERAALAQRHAEHYLALAEEAVLHLKTPNGTQWLNRLEAERDNFRAALAWWLENEPEAALRLAGALGSFWSLRGYYLEGREALGQALTRARDARPRWRERALWWAGQMASTQGDFSEAQRLLEEKLELTRERADRRGIAEALMALANVYRMFGDKKAARPLWEESLMISRELDDKSSIAAGLLELCTVGGPGDDGALGRALQEEGLQIYRQLGDPRGVARALNYLGITCYYAGRGKRLRGDPEAPRCFAEARRYFEESIAIFRELDNDPGRRFPAIHLAHVAVQQEAYEEATRLLQEALALCRPRGEKRLIVECLEGLAEVAVGQAEPERAARLLAAAAVLREATNFRALPEPGEAALERVRATLDDAAFAVAWEAGRALTWQQAVDYAMESEE
jgi:tetratricopeptide (TPR) repeat protein